MAPGDHDDVDEEEIEIELEHSAMSGEHDGDDQALVDNDAPAATPSLTPDLKMAPMLHDDLLAQTKMLPDRAAALRVKSLIQDPATDINRRDPVTGGTALHRAAYHGDKTAVAALLRRNVQRNVQDKQTLSTPLHCAAAQGHYAVCVLLLSGPNPADCHIRNINGRTAGDRAREQLHDKLASMLFHIEAGYNMCGEVEQLVPKDHGCMPRNGARTVVCIEKWVVVVLFALLTAASAVIVVYCMGSKEDCDDGKAASDSNMCDEYWTGIIAGSICGFIFFLLLVFFVWLFFFGPLRMKEPKKTR